MVRGQRRRKKATVEQSKGIGSWLKLCIHLFSTGKEFLVAAASLATAVVAMSGSCSNLRRTDASYAALASKVNDMSSRLDGIESSLDDLRLNKEFSCEPPEPVRSPASAEPAPAAPEPAPPEPMPLDKFEVRLMPKAAPLPETLDMLMQQQIIQLPQEKK